VIAPEDLYKQCSPAVVYITTVEQDEEGQKFFQGSGFLVASDGILVTNHHVVADACSVTVTLPSGATLAVEGVLALDEAADLAVLKVRGKDLPTLPLLPQGETASIGTQVYAIGSPKGLANTLSSGLVSGLPTRDGQPKLQTTAPISPGSSGGPILDGHGRVVGVAASGLVGDGAQNLNFAVPSGKVHEILAVAKTSTPIPLEGAGGKPMSGQSARDLRAAQEAIYEERWSDAVGILQALREKEPSNPEVWYLLGLLHKQLGNYDLALESFHEVTRLAPDSPIGYLWIGYTYQLREQYAESVAAFRTAIRLSPNYWQAHLALGYSLYLTERYADSVAACTNVIRIRADVAWAYYILTLDYWALGDRERAIRSYQTLQRLDPDLADRLSGD